MHIAQARIYQRPRIIHTTRDIIILAIVLIVVMLALIAHGVAQSVDNSTAPIQTSNATTNGSVPSSPVNSVTPSPTGSGNYPKQP